MLNTCIINNTIRSAVIYVEEHKRVVPSFTIYNKREKILYMRHLIKINNENKIQRIEHI